MAKFAVILPAAGQSSRFGDPRTKKVYAELDGRAVWLRAVEPFLRRDDVSQVILAIASEDRELVERRYGANLAVFRIALIDGGAERHETVSKALAILDPQVDHVAVHDAARPCVTTALIDRVFAAAVDHGAALPGLAVTDTLKRVDAGGLIVETVDREGLRGVQTPQAFRRDLIERAYARRAEVGATITDDAQLVEAIGHPCRIVEGSPFNLKITRQEDLQVAAAFLKSMPGPEDRRRPHPFADEGPT